ncbi:MAG TPA: cysteine synthase family protein [Candidatus Polarisedimenticolaceae bacterium]|nr:cysteine synthase family protein [Candidatus Polarisedimenticolaceae bacterium]
MGNTSMVRLRKVVPPGSAAVCVKLEWENPTGSMKDRMALAALAKAEADGRLRPGDTVVEYSGGSTGASLALVCAAKGYRLRIVTSDAFSQEKRDHMAALGAELVVLWSEGGLATRPLFDAMIATAREMSREAHTFWFDQLENRDIPPGYHGLGEEIWEQTGGRVDAFVHGAGSAASLRGVGEVLKRHRPGIRVAVMEPAESAVLSGGPAGGHRIEGIGTGRIPPLWDAALVDAVLPVSSDAAEDMAQRLAREEGLLAGTSSGGNVAAALRLAGELGPGATVVTLLVDSGLKYLSTGLYRSR